jgi:hypothetical protein
MTAYVNGREVYSYVRIYFRVANNCSFFQVTIDQPDPETSFLYFLRNERIPLSCSFQPASKLSVSTYTIPPAVSQLVSRYLTKCMASVHLTGSKLGCGEGGCGACTVMVSSYDREEDVIKHVAVNACLTPLCSVAGMAITTVEGIGSTRTSLHPVQVRELIHCYS